MPRFVSAEATSGWDGPYSRSSTASASCRSSALRLGSPSFPMVLASRARVRASLASSGPYSRSSMRRARSRSSCFRSWPPSFPQAVPKFVRTAARVMCSLPSSFSKMRSARSRSSLVCCRSPRMLRQLARLESSVATSTWSRPWARSFSRSVVCSCSFSRCARSSVSCSVTDVVSEGAAWLSTSRCTLCRRLSLRCAQELPEPWRRERREGRTLEITICRSWKMLLP
mmetsp:Transcript_30335/g.96987  ORF Transcript_30335/g.96987 Transcript_30335/m.96987 type:complete len:227 (-) Transcript_30335:245-925(-)